MPSRTTVKEREKSEGQQGFWPCAQRERERERERPLPPFGQHPATVRLKF